MELELHITVPGHGRAVLTGSGTHAFRLTFTVRGTAGAAAWLQRLLGRPHHGYTGYEGPWAGKIGGKLPRLMDVLMSAHHREELTVAIIKVPSEEEMPPPPLDEMTPPRGLIEVLQARARHRRGEPKRLSKRPTSHARRPENGRSRSEAGTGRDQRAVRGKG